MRQPIPTSTAAPGWRAVFMIPVMLPTLPWQGMPGAPLALGLKLGICSEIMWLLLLVLVHSPSDA